MQTTSTLSLACLLSLMLSQSLFAAEPPKVALSRTRVEILGPVTSGGPVKALPVPSDAQVKKTLEKVISNMGGLPYLCKRELKILKMKKQKIADYVDPPRVVPMIGSAQLHHAHYKCSIQYREVTKVSWPFPGTVFDVPKSAVVYIDHNHFHRVEAK